jgi:drug/metabolite transporter (DMT)-like permease
VQRWTASATAYTFVSMPLVAVLAGAALLDEKITLAVLSGGAIVVAGVYIGALRSRATSAAPEVPHLDAKSEP